MYVASQATISWITARIYVRVYKDKPEFASVSGIVPRLCDKTWNILTLNAPEHVRKGDAAY